MAEPLGQQLAYSLHYVPLKASSLTCEGILLNLSGYGYPHPIPSLHPNPCPDPNPSLHPIPIKASSSTCRATATASVRRGGSR